MKYFTYEPDRALAPFVKCYWTLESPKEDHPPRQTIVPDGCMEMIFHYGDLYKQYISGDDSIIQPRCFVIGQLTQPLEIEPTGETGIFSVRFRPGGFMPFATIPVKDLENKAIALEALFEDEGREIERKVLNAGTTLERISVIERFLTRRLADAQAADRIIQSTIETILAFRGGLSVDALSEESGIGRRQLERRFSSAVGLSPKKLSKIIRLHAALKLLHSRQDMRLTDLAYAGEYYDQAHFIKDFKAFTGLTPKEFYGDQVKISSLFYSAE